MHFFPDLVKSKRRPVIVWIHGGNFVRGSAADYEPDYILDEDVVLVTIQYRLGMFGFLSTEDVSAPGNYGMLDQVAALQWVKTNIEAFSGDPNRYVNNIKFLIFRLLVNLHTTYKEIKICFHFMVTSLAK